VKCLIPRVCKDRRCFP